MNSVTENYGEFHSVMYEDIRTLDSCEEELMLYLEFQIKNNADRNSEWFPRLLRDYKKYLFWTVCYVDEKIVAFSVIQDHFFPKGTVRILTRTFFDPEIRLAPGYNLWVKTPVAPMAKKQLEWLRKSDKYKKALVTVESRHNKEYFSKIINKINARTNANFKVLPERIQTYENQPQDLFQHAAAMDLVDLKVD